MILRKCECEHEAHFGPDVRTGLRPLTPNRNLGHNYGVEYNALMIVPVATPFGTFHVCKDCAVDCYAQFVAQVKA